MLQSGTRWRKSASWIRRCAAVRCRVRSN